MLWLTRLLLAPTVKRSPPQVQTTLSNSKQLDGKLLTTLKGHSAAYQVALCPDGKTIASTSWDSTVKLWQPDGTLLTTLNKHNDRLWGVALCPDGKTIASASEDKTVILWNLDRLLDLDKLMVYGCNWAHDYLKTNPNVHDSDRHICDQVGNQFFRW